MTSREANDDLRKSDASRVRETLERVRGKRLAAAAAAANDESEGETRPKRDTDGPEVPPRSNSRRKELLSRMKRQSRPLSSMLSEKI